MKRAFLSLFLLSTLITNAQQGSFLFLQEAKGHPFYIRLGEQNYSSSAGGHLIMAPMRDSVYSIYIGFAGGRYPEQLFTIEINGRDKGYELRRVDDQWQLSDLRTMAILLPDRLVGHAPGGVKRNDSYSTLMAAVVKDSAVLYSATLTSDAPSAGDSTVANKKAKPAPKQGDSWPAAPVVVNSAYDKRDIIRYSTENIIEGKLMIYVDRSAPVIDTIRLVIPRL